MPTPAVLLAFAFSTAQPGPPPIPPSLPARPTPGPTLSGLTIANVPFGSDDIAAAEQQFDDIGTPMVHLTFTDSGRLKFAALQQDRVGEPLDIHVDGALVASPFLVEPIAGAELMISGQFTVEEAQALAARLRPPSPPPG